MPLYEYQCDACGERFEAIRKFSDPPLDVCEKCSKGPVQRLVSSPAFQFKGSGWYITDYAKKGGGSTTDTADKDTTTSTKSDTASTDTAASKSTDSAKPADSGKSETPAKPAAASTSKD